MENKSVHLSKKRVLTYPALPKTRWNKLAIPYFLLLAICLWLIPCFSFYLQHSFRLEKQKILYTPSPKALKLLSGSFTSFLADMFYIRGVLGITEEFQDPLQRVSWIQDNFSMALSLDPKLVQGYFFAAMVIGHSKESIEKGIAFLEKHRGLNSSEWRIPYWLGFNYYQLGNYLKAAEYYQEASRLPGAPEFLKSNPAVFYYRAGRADSGVIYLRGLLSSLKEKRQAEWIKLKLEWLENIVVLEKKVTEFKSRFGYLPDNLEELVSRGLLSELPRDPFGKGYYLDKENARIKSRFNPSLKND